MTKLERALVEAKLELHRRERDWRRIYLDKDIPFLMSLMSFVDSRTGDEISFEHLREPLEEGEVWLDSDGVTLRCQGWDGPANSRGGNKTWRWQRYIVDRRLRTKRRIDLKGRQIGDTWINLGVDVAKALLMPGTDSQLFRQTEKQAIDNVQRWWTLFESLPIWILERVPAGKKIGPVVISRPTRGDRPGREGVSLRFANGTHSDIVPMTSTGGSGHGSSVRDVMLDEAGRIDELLEIRAAVEPSAGEEGEIGLISTAHGRSNPDTGEGNEFHRVWVDALEGSEAYDAIFLPYDLHPDRDEWWYEHAEEVRSLPLWKIQEQFPRKWQEAFALSDRVFFDEESLVWYLEHVAQPEYEFNFRFDEYRQAKAVKCRPKKGRMKMYRKPIGGREYAIMGDPASGHGRDSSAAFVIDLQTAELCVQYKAKVGEDEFGRDLYWLGKWYNTALIGIETQGGNGTATVISLRDGAEARPPYPKMYRHRNETNRDHPSSAMFGMPMDTKNRNLVVNQIEKWIRDRSLPYVTDDLHYEMTEFVEHDHGTTPRARDGSHDDLVMACAGALDLFRRYGRTIGRAHKKFDQPKPRDDAPRRDEELPRGFDQDRYRKNAPNTQSQRRVVRT